MNGVEAFFGLASSMQRSMTTYDQVSRTGAKQIWTSSLFSGLVANDRFEARRVQRTYKLAGGKIAQVAVNTHRASRFRHSMTMPLVKG
jgi:GntR family transcriptional regulator